MNNRIKEILAENRKVSTAKPPTADTAGDSERVRAETFLAFHAQNHSRLSAFVHTLVPSWQDAEEIIQDTLVVLWRKFEEFNPGTSFFAWSARVAQFEVLNHRRKNRHRVMVFDERILEALAGTALEQLDDMDLHREELEKCVKKLPDRDRELLRLRYQEGGDIQMAANAMQRSTGHVQRVLKKIRSNLLQCIHRGISGRTL